MDRFTFAVLEHVITERVTREYAQRVDTWRQANPAGAAILDNPFMLLQGVRVTIRNDAEAPSWSVYDAELLRSLGVRPA